MDFRSILAVKRDGGALSEAQIRWFMARYVAGELEDHHAAALLACIYLRGMQPGELVAWTRGMLESGTRLAFPELGQRKADKHSTGGVGDKVSIPLAPAVAACGVAVPMISGRGLGHTGGTLDKLESIPGMRVELSEAEIHRVIGRTGVAFAAQTDQIVPADKKLYRLRDATGLVASIPLIASSILSKKLAEGLDALVLDVKYGSGAFLPDPERGAELARTMIALGAELGLVASAFQTAMDRPLGRAVGHALEIHESVECLRGGGPTDLRELVCLQGGEMLRLTGRAADLADGQRQIADALDSGRALRVLELVVGEQGGDARAVTDPTRLPRAPAVDPWTAARAGHLAFADCGAVGLAVAALGGGRERMSDAIDPAVGLVWRKRAGERVERGDVVCEIHHARGRGLELCRSLLERAVAIGPPAAPTPLVLAHLAG